MPSNPNHTPRTYDIMRHGNDGYGVVCNIDGVFENAIPFDAYRDAELFLEELEERELAEAEERRDAA